MITPPPPRARYSRPTNSQHATPMAPSGALRFFWLRPPSPLLPHPSVQNLQLWMPGCRQRLHPPRPRQPLREPTRDAQFWLAPSCNVFCHFCCTVGLCHCWPWPFSFLWEAWGTIQFHGQHSNLNSTLVESKWVGSSKTSSPTSSRSNNISRRSWSSCSSRGNTSSKVWSNRKGLKKEK